MKTFKEFINETKEQQDTPQFKAWFSGSKVVDDKGNPLVVYHGSKRIFSEFKDSLDIGFHFGTKSQANDRGYGGVVYPVYLSLRTVVTVKGDEFDHNFYKVSNFMILNVPSEWKNVAIKAAQASREYSDDYMGAKAARKVWIDAGVDGFKYINKYEGDKGEGNNISWIVLDPKNIKSAIGNKGSYDFDDHHIAK